MIIAERLNFGQQQLAYCQTPTSLSNVTHQVKFNDQPFATMMPTITRVVADIRKKYIVKRMEGFFPHRDGSASENGRFFGVIAIGMDPQTFNIYRVPLGLETQDSHGKDNDAEAAVEALQRYGLGRSDAKFV